MPRITKRYYLALDRRRRVHSRWDDRGKRERRDRGRERERERRAAERICRRVRACCMCGAWPAVCVCVCVRTTEDRLRRNINLSRWQYRADDIRGTSIIRGGVISSRCVRAAEAQSERGAKRAFVKVARLALARYVRVYVYVCICAFSRARSPGVGR